MQDSSCNMTVVQRSCVRVECHHLKAYILFLVMVGMLAYFAPAVFCASDLLHIELGQPYYMGLVILGSAC